MGLGCTPRTYSVTLDLQRIVNPPEGARLGHHCKEEWEGGLEGGGKGGG